MVAADERPVPIGEQKPLALEHYDYGMHLDIARVIRPPHTPKVCRVVPVQMTYEDHQGKRHRLEYLTMGNGCPNS